MKNALIIDDSKITREFHSSLLKEAGFECVTAIDGSDGLEKALSMKFSIIITDINMQNMDGCEFIRRIRTYPDYEDVPIIIISTEKSLAEKQIALMAGANLYLVKPVNENAIITAINTLLGKS